MDNIENIALNKNINNEIKNNFEKSEENKKLNKNKLITSLKNLKSLFYANSNTKETGISKSSRIGEEKGIPDMFELSPEEQKKQQIKTINEQLKEMTNNSKEHEKDYSLTGFKQDYEKLAKEFSIDKSIPGLTQYQQLLVYSLLGKLAKDVHTTEQFLKHPEWNIDEANPIARMLGVRKDNPNASGLPLFTASAISTGLFANMLMNPNISKGKKNTLLILANLLYGFVPWDNEEAIRSRDIKNTYNSMYIPGTNHPQPNILIEIPFLLDL